MARINLTVPGDNSEVNFAVHLGDEVFISFNSGPNTGPAYIAVGSSGGVGFSTQLYADTEATQPLGARSGSVGTVDCKFGIGPEVYQHYPSVGVNVPLLWKVLINATDPDARDPNNPGQGCSVNLHLPQPQKTDGPHRRHNRTR